MKRQLRVLVRLALGLAVTASTFQPVMACGGRRGGYRVYGGYSHPSVIVRKKVVVHQPIHLVQPPMPVPLAPPAQPIVQPASFNIPSGPAVADLKALQLVDVRFVDQGEPERGIGPRYRIALRNTAAGALTLPVDVMLVAGIDQNVQPGLPHAKERVPMLNPGQVTTLDIRLPAEALSMRYPGEQRPALFNTLFVVALSQADLIGNMQLHPLATLPRIGIPMADLALLTPANSMAPVGAVLTLTGEGLGTQPGRVILNLEGVDLNAEIVGWNLTAIQVRVPNLNLAAPTGGKIIVIRADGQQAPLPIQLVGAQSLGNNGPQGGIQAATPGQFGPPQGPQGAPGQQFGQMGSPGPNGMGFGAPGMQTPNNGGFGMSQVPGAGQPGIPNEQAFQNPNAFPGPNSQPSMNGNFGNPNGPTANANGFGMPNNGMPNAMASGFQPNQGPMNGPAIRQNPQGFGSPDAAQIERMIAEMANGQQMVGPAGQQMSNGQLPGNAPVSGQIQANPALGASNQGAATGGQSAWGAFLSAMQGQLGQGG